MRFINGGLPLDPVTQEAEATRMSISIRIKKKLRLAGLDPVTHKPINGGLPLEEQVGVTEKEAVSSTTSSQGETLVTEHQEVPLVLDVKEKNKQVNEVFEGRHI
ncbi:hypothetical protein QJS10_CPA16g00267 [Acorus calamus]|uniref:Uncharacterized protein n=1 Tax=Acorus calamus TaxID=4465 RepID=A0AAV9D139_ACOCL|nr:hypothetical protein QJS10_CPA16g00267 [Acorus calamus]